MKAMTAKDFTALSERDLSERDWEGEVHHALIQREELLQACKDLVNLSALGMAILYLEHSDDDTARGLVPALKAVIEQTDAAIAKAEGKGVDTGLRDSKGRKIHVGDTIDRPAEGK